MVPSAFVLVTDVDLALEEELILAGSAGASGAAGEAGEADEAAAARVDGEVLIERGGTLASEPFLNMSLV